MSLRELAQKLGVSTALVSMALRDKGRVSPETRLKIKAAAEAMEYHIHPVISKGYSLARGSMSGNYRETLAFITEYPEIKRHHYHYEARQGASERAKQLGYLLETFVVSDKRSDQQNLSRILVARGIRGLIIVPRVKCPQPRLYFDWKQFASVEIHRMLWYPRGLHYVGSTTYQKILEALHLLKKVGFKRIGMAIDPQQNHFQKSVFTAAYQVAQSKLPVSRRIPPLLSFGPWGEETFKRWLDRYQPDVLYRHDRDIPDWVEKLGMKVPEDISLFCANINNDILTSGLRRDYFSMGQSAVEMLSLLLGNNTLGLAKSPRCWLVEEIWQPGTTLRHSIAPYVCEDGYSVQTRGPRSI